MSEEVKDLVKSIKTETIILEQKVNVIDKAEYLRRVARIRSAVESLEKLTE